MAANQGLLMVAGIGAIAFLMLRKGGGGEDGPLSFLGSGRSIGNIGGGGGSDPGAAVDGVINEFGADFWGMFSQGAAGVSAAVFGPAAPTSAAAVVSESDAERDDIDPSGESKIAQQIDRGWGNLREGMSRLEISQEVFANPTSFVGDTAPGQVRKSAEAAAFQAQINQAFDDKVNSLNARLNPPPPNLAYGADQTTWDTPTRKEKTERITTRYSPEEVDRKFPGAKEVRALTRAVTRDRFDYDLDISHGDFEYD